MVKGQKHLSACSQDPLHSLALTSAMPPVDGNNGFALCCQRLTEKSLSTSSFCCSSRWFNMCLLEWNHCWICWKSFMITPPHITDAESKLRTETEYTGTPPAVYIDFCVFILTAITSFASNQDISLRTQKPTWQLNYFWLWREKHVSPNTRSDSF